MPRRVGTGIASFSRFNPSSRRCRTTRLRWPRRTGRPAACRASSTTTSVATPVRALRRSRAFGRSGGRAAEPTGRPSVLYPVRSFPSVLSPVCSFPSLDRPIPAPSSLLTRPSRMMRMCRSVFSARQGKGGASEGAHACRGRADASPVPTRSAQPRVRKAGSDAPEPAGALGGSRARRQPRRQRYALFQPPASTDMHSRALIPSSAFCKPGAGGTDLGHGTIVAELYVARCCVPSCMARWRSDAMPTSG